MRCVSYWAVLNDDDSVFEDDHAYFAGMEKKTELLCRLGTRIGADYNGNKRRFYKELVKARLRIVRVQIQVTALAKGE